jgi:hypothetical protein
VKHSKVTHLVVYDVRSFRHLILNTTPISEIEFFSFILIQEVTVIIQMMGVQDILVFTNLLSSAFVEHALSEL